MKIAFLGGGNMAGALIGGLVAKGFEKNAISVIEMAPAAREKLAEKFGVRVSTAPDASTQGSDVLVLAVKPQDMQSGLASLAGSVRGKLVISIAAGITIGALSRWLEGHRRIVRCMPNTPALVGAGIAALYAPPEVGEEDRKKAETILRAAGEAVWVPEERLLDPVTAVSGSGPAYVFWFIEQLATAAVELGIAEPEAKKLALHTVLGAAKLAVSSPSSAAELRQQVTSKGGTTEAALDVFAQEQLAERFRRAVKAASDRAAALGVQLGKGRDGNV